MKYEVEQKFPVRDMAVLEGKLAELGAVVSEPQVEEDLYFAHPTRDFAETDEALRIRRKGESCLITYKGPKIDSTTKTRREIELPVPRGESTWAAWIELLEALGFTRVAEVRKSRRKTHIPWQGWHVEASLDDVEQLGSFAELELVVEDDAVDTARASIAALAETLELAGGERRSYLELLLGRA